MISSPILRTVLLTCISLIAIFEPAYSQYWQQDLKYKIEVRLDDSLHFLYASAQIDYKNNSPVELTELWFHLWPNAYKDNTTAFAKQQVENGSTLFQYASQDRKGYIDSLDFQVNSRKVEMIPDPGNPDICRLLLNEPLRSGETIRITTPFRVKIPDSFSRLGHGGQSYQISQWYPKPAVFDKNGWSPMPYLDQGEFYSEFATYDVYITLPENYVIGATGDLQTESEKLFLDSVIARTGRVKDFSAEPTGFPASALGYKTVHYHQDRVHDFAWFADKRFYVLKGEVELPHSKRKVDTYVMFTQKYAKYWKKSVEYINDAIYYYSLWNGDYPYHQATAVDGYLSAGGGMEYPNVTVIGSVSSDRTLERVIMHEVGHNWFYGILGSNERVHGWMDEGINTYNEHRYIRTKYPNDKLMGKYDAMGFSRFFRLAGYPGDEGNYLQMMLPVSKHEDQPIETHSKDFTPLNYGMIMYQKTGLALRYLEQYLGTAVFDSAMRTYFERWKFKHPQPEDYKAVMEEVSGKNLDWFFDDLFKTKENVDFKLKDVADLGPQLRVKVKNKTSYPAPVFVSSVDRQGRVLETFKTEPFTGTSLIFFEKQGVSKIRIDPYSIIPEINRNNNTMRVHGILRSTEKLNLQLLGSVKNPDRTQLFFTPLIAYNAYDKLMPGVAFYNHLFPFRNFEYELAPFYSPKTERLNGLAQVAYYFYPEGLKRLTLKANYKAFSSDHSIQAFTDPLTNNSMNLIHDSHYQKLAGSIEMELKREARSRKQTLFEYRYVYTNTESSFSPVQLPVPDGTGSFHILNVYNHNGHLFNPFSWYVNVNYGTISSESFLRLALECNQFVRYRNSRKGLSIRAFAGIVPDWFSDQAGGFFNISGANDFLYDNNYIERNDPYHQQFYIRDGGFKSNVYLPNVSNVLALNIKAPLKIRLPLGFFADAAYTSQSMAAYSRSFIYDAGIYLPLVNELVEIYLPVYVSTLDGTSAVTAKPSFGNSVRIMLNINRMNPFTLMRNLKLG